MFVIITQNICSCCFCLNYSIWGYKVLMLLVALRILMFHCCNLLRISLQLNRNYFSTAWKNNIFYTNNKKKTKNLLAPFSFSAVHCLLDWVLYTEILPIVFFLFWTVLLFSSVFSKKELQQFSILGTYLKSIVSYQMFLAAPPPIRVALNRIRNIGQTNQCT